MKFFGLTITFVLGLSLCLPLFGQSLGNVEKQQNLEALGQTGNQGIVRTFDNRYEGVRGTPYLFNDWVKGAVILRDSTMIDDVFLQYDAYQGELLAKRNNKEAITIDKNQVRGFRIGKPGIKNFSHFSKAQYLDEFQEAEPEQFVQILYDGPSALYALHKKGLIKANYKGAYSAGKAYDEFTKTSTQYYLRSPEGIFVKVKPTKKDLLKIFSSDQKKVKEFIEKNNLVLEESTDLVKVAMFYDQLHS